MEVYADTLKKNDERISFHSGEKALLVVIAATYLTFVTSAAAAIHFKRLPRGRFVQIPLQFLRLPPLSVRVPLMKAMMTAGGAALFSRILMSCETVKDTVSKALGTLRFVDLMVSIKGYTREDIDGWIQIFDQAANFSPGDEKKTPEEWLTAIVEKIKDTSSNNFAKAFVQRLREDRAECSFQGQKASKMLHGSKISWQDFKNSLNVWHPESLAPRSEVDLGSGNKGEIKSFKTADLVDLRGYWHASNKTKAPVVILFHGNAMLAHNMEGIATEYANKGYSVLIPEYRGCGISGGKRDKARAYECSQFDADAAYNFVIQQAGGECQVVVHGLSLGGGVAAGLAQRNNLTLVLDHTFDEPIGTVYHGLTVTEDNNFFVRMLKNGLRGAVWSMRPFVNSVLALKERSSQSWRTKDRVKELIAQGNKRLFIIAGKEDRVTPPGCSESIVSHAKLKDSGNFLVDEKGEKRGGYFLVDGGHGRTDTGVISQIAGLLDR